MGTEVGCDSSLVAHDRRGTDPERSWNLGRIYACPKCNEQVRVDLDRDERTPR